VNRKSVELTTPITFPEDGSMSVMTYTGAVMLQYCYDVLFKFTGRREVLL
jgi:hypothetical protein